MLSPDATRGAAAQRSGTGIVSTEPPARSARASARSRTARLLVLDALVAVLAAEVGILAAPHGQRPTALLLAGAAGMVAPLWLLALSLAGAYDPQRRGSEASRRVALAAIGLLAALGVSPVAGLAETTRSTLAVALPLAGLLTITARWSSAGRRRRDDGRGAAAHRVVVAGGARDVERVVTALRTQRTPRVELVGACLAELGPWPVACAGVPVIAHLHDAAEAASHVGAGILVVAGAGELEGADLRRLAWSLEGTGCRLAAALPATDVAGHRLRLGALGGASVAIIREPVLGGALRVVKEVVERTAALLLGVLLSPLLVALALAVRLSGDGPVLFRQTRVGLRGRLFTILKFRTMHAGAEAEQVDVLHLNEHHGPHFKAREDPRITRVGRWLRRSSLDELPQLWNVVNGSMSLVGPRPPLPWEVESYEPDAFRRLLVKPGMTGLWQVSGRADLPWEEALQLDLFYVDNWSPILDAGIVARTFSAVILGRGAY